MPHHGGAIVPACPPLEDNLSNDPLLPLFQQAVARALGHPAELRGVTRRENPNATLFPSEVVRLAVDGSADVEIFLKRLTREEVQHPDKLGPEIEVRVYRELFQDVPHLAVPPFLGSAPIEGADGFHLLLRHVAGRMLKHCPPQDWCTAARRLGELHRFFRGESDDPADRSWLLRMDRTYYLEWADRAREGVAGTSGDLAARLEDALAGYDGFAEQIANRPVTLVHNDLSSRNVLVVADAGPAEIYFVDWETAGLGCGLVDLIHMKYNRLDADADRAVTADYLEALGDPDLPSPEDERTRWLLDAVELHFTLYRIAHSAGWGESLEHLTRRVERAVAVRARLDS